MVVDPFGDIIAQCSDKEGVVICELDLDYLDKVRSSMNCLTHMRTDVLVNNLTVPIDHPRKREHRQKNLIDESFNYQ